VAGCAAPQHLDHATSLSGIVRYQPEARRNHQREAALAAAETPLPQHGSWDELAGLVQSGPAIASSKPGGDIELVAQTESEPAPPKAGAKNKTSAAADPPPAADDRQTLPINLATALSLAGGENPAIGAARARVRAAYAQYEAAHALWLPTIQAGVNYNKHEGRIQDVAGNIIETSRGSAYGGLGSMAVGAGSPAVPGLIARFHLTDAIYAPRIADRQVAARRQLSKAAEHDVLLAAALAYVDLLTAAQEEAIASETQELAEALAKLTRNYAETGAGTQADADRAATELALRTAELERTREGVQVASVRLARVLSQPPAVTLSPDEPAIVPIELVDVAQPVHELVSLGLAQRPELAAHRSLVAEARARLDREQHAPLVPSVLLGLSYGANGGGLGSDISNTGDRLDFDAGAWWQVRNLGVGERAARCEAQARLTDARFQQVAVLDQVAAEVAEAHAQASARKRQIPLVEASIRTAETSYNRNRERIQEGEGLPLEALQSIQALDQARRLYLRAVSDYNAAQFRLQRALGWPVSLEAKGD
jgi:outer membrane protein TolC